MSDDPNGSNEKAPVPAEGKPEEFVKRIPPDPGEGAEPTSDVVRLNSAGAAAVVVPGLARR